MVIGRKIYLLPEFRLRFEKNKNLKTQNYEIIKRWRTTNVYHINTITPMSILYYKSC